MIISNTSEVKISLVQEAEIPLLIESISKNFAEKDSNKMRKFNREHWYWQYKLNPKKQSFLYAAWINKEIVGYYHIVIHNFIANGKKYVIGNVQDVAVDKKFQGQGIFRKLSTFANSDINKHVDILYSFPNKKSINTFLKYDKFKLVDCMPIYLMPLKIESIIGSKFNFFGLKKISNLLLDFFYTSKKKALSSNNKLVVFNQLDEKIYEIFEKFSKTHTYHVLRDKAFLNWRYINSPKGNFFFVGLMTDDKISSIIVVKHEKIYENEAFIILDFAYTDNIDDLKKLICNFHVVLNNNNSLNANFVLVSGLSRYMSEARKCGYISIPKLFIPRRLNLLVRSTDRYLKIDNINSSDWLVTLGDWDVF